MKRLALLLLALAVAVALLLPRFVAAQSVPAPPGLVYTHQDQVFLRSSAHAARALTRPVRTPGAFPYYAWSPDGQYLLLVKTLYRQTGTYWQLRLLDPGGQTIRTLATVPTVSSFLPSWAVDGDQIAYVAGLRGNNQVVRRIDLTGTSTNLWDLPMQQGGCGGGGAPDPAQLLYWTAASFGDMPGPLSWSLKQNLAIYRNQLIDTVTGAAQSLGTRQRWVTGGVLSSTGGLAVTVSSCGRKGCTVSVGLVDRSTGKIRTLGPGENPAWSADGSMLFYVQRTPGKVLKFSDPNGVPLQSTLMTSRLWQAAADGSHPIMLVSEPAFGLASISYQAATKTLIYSRVDTVARLWAHRLSNGRYTAALLKKYGPRVSVEQLPLGGTPTTQVANAGRPMLQP